MAIPITAYAAVAAACFLHVVVVARIASDPKIFYGCTNFLSRPLRPSA
jgi:hypothetical protein